MVAVSAPSSPRRRAAGPPDRPTPPRPSRPSRLGRLDAQSLYYAEIEDTPILLPEAQGTLCARMQAGDPAARTQLYLCALRWVAAYTTRLCRWYGLHNADKQFEIVQAANESVWRQMPAFDARRATLTTWVAVILKRDVPRLIECNLALIPRAPWVL